MTTTAPLALAPPGTLLTGPHYLRALLALVATATASIDCALFLAACPGRAPVPGYLALWDALSQAPMRSLRCRALLQTHPPRSPLYNSQTGAAFALHAAGWSVRYTPPNRTLHAKFWILDTHHILIGSHNLTGRALGENIEASIHIAQRQTAVALRALYSALWATSTPHLLH